MNSKYRSCTSDEISDENLASNWDISINYTESLKDNTKKEKIEY